MGRSEHGRRDVVRRGIVGIVDEAERRILPEQLVETLGKVAAHEIDLLDASIEEGVEERIDDAHTVDPHQRLGAGLRDGHHPRTEA